MEERKEIINRYIQKGLNVTEAVQTAGLSRSAYYYKSNGQLPGKRPTSYTLKKDGTKVKNSVVIETIKEIISPDFIDYGYEKVTAELHKKQYIINHKKVYRLMKEHRLLNPKRKLKKEQKNYAQYFQPCPAQPFEVLEIDIKYIYIRGDRRNAFLITILDVFTRKALVWELDFSMKSARVVELIDQLIKQVLQPEDLLNRGIAVTIRSDNGSQFIANIVRKHLKVNQIFQEFIQPATPEQNGYIESFHSTVEKLVCQKFEFDSLAQAKDIFKNFYETYNKKRILKCLLFHSPDEFILKWDNNELAVAYNTVTKKQLFFFREKQKLQPFSLPSQRNSFICHGKNNETFKYKNNFYLCN